MVGHRRYARWGRASAAWALFPSPLSVPLPSPQPAVQASHVAVSPGHAGSHEHARATRGTRYRGLPEHPSAPGFEQSSIFYYIIRQYAPGEGCLHGLGSFSFSGNGFYRARERQRKKQFIGSPNGDPMRSVRMPAVFLPCSDGSPEWIPHGGPLLQRPPAACTHLVPDLAGTKCSKRARRTCKPQHHSWQSVDIVEDDSNQDILIREMQGAYIHHLSRGP